MNKAILHKRIFGFTLAEVLITLGIIGIVASITVPTIVANAQKQEYVAKLKKTYSTLNQAFNRYSADKGCSQDLKCSGLYANAIDNTHLAPWDEFTSNYLKAVKNCQNKTNQGCFPSVTKLLNYSGNSNYDNMTDYKVTLADGASILFNRMANCNFYRCWFSNIPQ